MYNFVDEIILAEHKEELKRLLEQLTPDEKQLIELRNYQELSYAQIVKIIRQE